MQNAGVILGTLLRPSGAEGEHVTITLSTGCAALHPWLQSLAASRPARNDTLSPQMPAASGQESSNSTASERMGFQPRATSNAAPCLAVLSPENDVPLAATSGMPCDRRTAIVLAVRADAVEEVPIAGPLVA
jgi:hypothetical protein